MGTPERSVRRELHFADSEYHAVRSGFTSGDPVAYPASIWIMGNGTVGWANSNPGFGDNINYGRLYVYGIQIPQGVPWIGNVFPTDKTVSWGGLTLPCFAVTPGLAEIISNQPR